MLFKEIIAVYSENHDTDKYILWEKRKIVYC
jgi:hypothetical protein